MTSSILPYQVDSLQGLHKEIARLQGELERVRREGEEERRRSGSQEARYTTGEQVTLYSSTNQLSTCLSGAEKQDRNTRDGGAPGEGAWSGNLLVRAMDVGSGHMMCLVTYLL